MLIWVCLGIVLILTQDRCAVCAERTVGSEIILDTADGSFYLTLVMWNLVSIHLETVVVSVQDRCTVYAKRTIGTKINSDAPHGTPR
jgi:hypothetical protein